MLLVLGVRLVPIEEVRLKTKHFLVQFLLILGVLFSDQGSLAQDEPPSADRCNKTIGEGWALANWGAIGRRSPGETSFAELTMTLCSSGCYGFCFDLTNSNLSPPVRAAVGACRNGADVPSCKSLMRLLKVPLTKAAKEGKEIGVSEEKLCLYAGGGRCFVAPRSLSLHDAMSIAAAKMACLSGITGACVLHDRHIAQTVESAKVGCLKSGGGACSEYVSALFRNGQEAEAQAYGVKVCGNEKSGQECVDFTHAANEFKQDAIWLPKLEELCTKKHLEAACGPWISQLVKSKQDGEANRLSKELCLNSNKRWFQSAVCSDYGVRLLGAGDQKGAESVIRRSCGLGPGQVPGQTCPALRFVQASRNKSHHFSRVNCKRAGKTDFIDRSGQVVLSVECAEGLRHGLAKYDSSSFEALPFLFSDMEIPYQKGVVAGLVKVRAYVQDMDYHYYAFSDGKLSGVAQVGGYRSSYNDGILSGRNVSTAYGRVSEVDYVDGRRSLLKRPPKLDCRNKPDMDKQVRDNLSLITNGCRWDEKQDVVFASDGTVARRRTVAGSTTVVQSLRDGAVVVELVCQDGGRTMTVKSYEPTQAEEATYRNTQPTFKRVQFSVQNGKLNGPALTFNLGELKFSGIYSNGNLKSAEGC